MAPQQIRVPHLETYTFGVGVDRLSGMALNLGVNPTPSSPLQAGGSTQSFEVTRVTSTHDLAESLGISVEASYGCASFGAGVSARFSYAQNSEVHSSSLFLMVSATVHLADLSIGECVLTPSAAATVGNPAAFRARYGDMFARACKRGGLFVGLMRVETYDETQSTKIEADLRGSYGMFSAEASSNFAKVTHDYNATVYCSVYCEGGPALQISNPGDPMQLLGSVNTWLKAMNDDPARYAVPYEWTLAPLTIAEGPLPPNAADLEHAQDVVKFCAAERSALLDQLHQLSWWHHHADRYDWSGSSQVDVTTAMAASQNDLDVLAACAGQAIDDPSKAVLPAAFAAARGGTYPSAAVPTAPTALPGTTPPPPPPTGGGIDPRFLKDRISATNNASSISAMLRGQG